MQIRTVVVTSTAGGDYVADDIRRQVAWSFRQPHLLVLVDEVGNVASPEGGGVVLRAPMADGQGAADWGLHVGLQYLAEAELSFERVILMRDTTLLIGEKMDEWALSILTERQLGLVGVQDVTAREREFAAATPVWEAMSVSHQFWENPPVTFASDFLVLNSGCFDELMTRGAFLAKRYAAWPTTLGAYLSWLVQLMGFGALAWGYTNKHLPPLYIEPTPGLPQQPAPHCLSAMFGAYGPITGVAAYAANDIREMYKGRRGERMKPVTPLSPIVNGLGMEVTRV